MTVIEQQVGRNEEPIGAFAFSDHSNALLLTAGTAASITVPAGYDYVAFDTDLFIWVAVDAVASVPAANITDGTAPHPNPGFRHVVPGQVLSVVSETEGVVGIYFYKA